MKNLDEKVKDLVKTYKKVVNILLKSKIIVISTVAKGLSNYWDMMMDIKRKQTSK